MIQDMTAGKPWKMILGFSIPLLIGNLFQQLYNMADSVIVGRMVGMQALAALGATGAIFFLVIGSVMGLTTGFSIITAQRFGAGDEEGVRRSVAMSILLSIFFTVVLTILSVATARPLLQIMNTPADIFDDAWLYIVIIYAGLGAAMYYNLVANILRALGDGKTPLYFLILSSILNIVLDIYLIGSFHMGVAGAGLATVIAQLVSAIGCTCYVARKFPILHMKAEHFHWDNKNAKAHLRVGVPMAIQFAITAVGVMVMQAALNNFGSVAIAGFTAANKVETLVTQPFMAIGITMATYCGQNRGARKMDRIRQGIRVALAISCGAVILAALLNVWGGRFFTELFITDKRDFDNALYYAQQYLNVIAVFYITLAVLHVFRNSLQGMGEAAVPVFGGVMELVARVIVSLLLPAKLGYLGVCLASPAAWIAADIPLLLRYYFKMKKDAPIHKHIKTLEQKQCR